MSASANSTAVPMSIPPPAPSLDNTYGAFLIATFIGLMLYGLTAHQTYRYFTMCRNDIWLLKLLVIALFTADTVHSALSMHASYYILVTNYFTPSVLAVGTWSMRVLIPVMTFIIVLTQGFYARRVYLINRKYTFIVVPAAIFLIAATGFAIAATVKGLTLATIEEWNAFAWLTSASHTLVLVTDFMLAGTLINYLRRRRTGVKRTDSMLNVLIIYTVNTGLVTSTMCSLCLIFTFAQPENMISSSVALVTTRCYVMAIMAVLTSRRTLKDSSTQVFDEFGTFGMTSAVQAGPENKQPTFPVFRSWRSTGPRGNVVNIGSKLPSDSSSSVTGGNGDETPKEKTLETMSVGETDKVATIC